MANPIVSCFLEDLMHEQMVTALIHRIAEEEGIPRGAVAVDSQNARGGVPAVARSFTEFAHRLLASAEDRPDIVVVALDSDCDSQERGQLVADIVAMIRGFTCVVVCMPAPYIERWYLADLQAIKVVFGHGPDGQFPARCDKSYYKTLLEKVVIDAGIEPTLGGYEFADLIVAEMDLRAAARVDSGLDRFADDLRACIREFQRVSHAAN